MSRSEKTEKLLYHLSLSLLGDSCSEKTHLENVGEVLKDLTQLEPKKRQDVKLLISALNSSAIITLASGSRKNSQNGEDQYSVLLENWSKSKLQKFRQAAVSLTRIILRSYYSRDYPEVVELRRRVSYERPRHSEDSYAEKIESVSIRQFGESSCEYLVIGSGAGGGVAAGLLAEAGKDVIVLEKGVHKQGGEISQSESEAYADMYETRGLLDSYDGSVGILAGSCMGGGTAVNWNGSFRMPDYVFDGWQKRHFLSSISREELDSCYDEVAQRIRCQRSSTVHNEQNKALARACEKAGYPFEDIWRNQESVGPERENAKGFECFGDPTNTKQSTLQTYLRSAVAHGARLVSNAKASSLEISSQEIVAVNIEDNLDPAMTKRIKAENVVMAGGALATAPLLMASDHVHPTLGQNLFLHPTVPVAGFYQDKMSSWNGNMMSLETSHFSNLDEGYGFKIETAPVHPSMASLVFPWKSSSDHSALMERLENLAIFIPLLRDRIGGRITLDKKGRRIIDYRINSYDLIHLLKGVKESLSLHFLAGAESVLIPHNSSIELLAKDHEQVSRVVDELNWSPNFFPLFSAHQMGCCAMGGNASQHPVDPEGKLRGVSNCYVVDSSVFPESSGVNPMLSIMALATRTIRHLI